MKRRCDNQAAPGYHHYGGRGIKVCERWRSFENFYADMGDAPAGMSIDRIDNDSHYEPGNCRWATDQEQLNNTSVNVVVEFRGARYTIAELARKQGIADDRLRQRLRAGWPVEKAASLPTRRYKQSDSHA